MRLRGKAIVVVVCLAALAAIVVSACGSGGGNDFAAEANQVCKGASEQSVAIYVSPVGAETSRKDAIAAETKYLENAAEREKQLQALEPPAEDKSAFETFLAAVKKNTENERKAIAAAKENEKAEFGKLQEEGSTLAKERTKDAAAISGLDVCAERMSAKGKKEVAETIEHNETIAEPSQCTEYVMPNLVKLQWKTLEGCREFQSHESSSELPRSVDVEVSKGIDGVTATAYATFHGGKGDGKTAELGMAFEDGKWKLAYAGVKKE